MVEEAIASFKKYCPLYNPPGGSDWIDLGCTLGIGGFIGSPSDLSVQTRGELLTPQGFSSPGTGDALENYFAWLEELGF